MTTAPSPSDHDHVVRKHGDAAAADRLLPADEGQPGDGGRAPRRRRTRRASPLASTPTPSRTTPSVTRAVTPRFFMRALRMSPKMPASRRAHGVDDDDAALRHLLDGGAGRARRRPGFRRRQVLAGRHEAEGEGPSDDALSRMAEAASGPRIQVRRMPFLRRTVVRVAVEVARSASAMALSRVMASLFSSGRPSYPGGGARASKHWPLCGFPLCAARRATLN